MAIWLNFSILMSAIWCLTAQTVPFPRQGMRNRDPVLYKAMLFDFGGLMPSNGLVYMSRKLSATFQFSKRAYAEISICYSENPGRSRRNISVTPWFVCPWNKSGYRYCCGSVPYQYCCRYFDRTGPLVALIVGVAVVILLGFTVVFRLIRKHKTRIDCHAAMAGAAGPMNRESQYKEHTVSTVLESNYGIPVPPPYTVNDVGPWSSPPPPPPNYQHIKSEQTQPVPYPAGDRAAAADYPPPPYPSESAARIPN